MYEQRRLAVAVECYAGHRGEQTPRSLILGGRRIGVLEVLDAWLAPDHRYFKLKGDDGDTYLVRHDERSNSWELTMFRANRVRPRGELDPAGIGAARPDLVAPAGILASSPSRAERRGARRCQTRRRL